jgi:pimeloyl-ACP methyl ester carboxylesterase
MKTIAMALAAALMTAAPPYAAKSTAIVQDHSYATPQQMVDVGGGRRMNLNCMGHGTPVVVFDAGLGNWNQLWGLVQPVIAKKTTACSYDRAGLGFSDPSEGDGSSAVIVDDLHKLLANARVNPPYVLVGHSYGGMSMRLFADKYFSEVIGMVLVDPSTRDLAPQKEKLPAPMSLQRTQEAEEAERKANRCINAAETGFQKDSDVYRECVDDKPNTRYSPDIDAVYQRLQLTPSYLKARWKEEVAISGSSADQLREASRTYGALPLIVLTQSEAAGPNPSTSGFVKAHEKLAALSTIGEDRIVGDSSHNIPFDQPAAVIKAINDVLDQASK